MNVNITTLTKDYILSKCNQVSIFSKYLNLDEDLIHYCINTGSLIQSPIRDDPNPSFGFKYNNKGKLKAKDFSGRFWGDCFDMVALLHQYKVGDKLQFYSILKVIATDFKLIDDNTYCTLSSDHMDHIKTIKTSRANITCSVRDWNSKDLTYWGSFNITRDILNLFNVFPVQNYWINADSQPEPKYHYNRKDPCYMYYYRKDKEGIPEVKLYFPYRKRDANNNNANFICNTNVLQGLHMIDYTKKYETDLIIPNSYKGVMTLHSLGYMAIAPQSESTFLTEQQFKYLSTIFSRIVIFYDNDEAGIANAKKYSNIFNIPYINISTADFDATDISELIVETDTNEVLDWLQYSLSTGGSNEELYTH